MQAELKTLIESKDVIVLTSFEKVAASWLLEQCKGDSDILVMEDAHDVDTQSIVTFIRQGLSENKKLILTAQFRSQLPIINIASICNEQRKSLINIELSGWDQDKAQPDSFSSF
ncbi:hypothetical protein [Vibrio maerlii]|uniref:hypothetical protein n=1 Tax=Vibrio maerlii TaxID=2231648 RepID=UPI000E3BB0FA|nr:hypothetical protein [Vibrio maerlii]